MKSLDLKIVGTLISFCLCGPTFAVTTGTVANQNYTLRLDATENPQISSIVKKSIASSCNDNSKTVPLTSKAAADGTQKLFCTQSGKPVINMQTQTQVNTAEVVMKTSASCDSGLCP